MNLDELMLKFPIVKTYEIRNPKFTAVVNFQTSNEYWTTQG